MKSNSNSLSAFNLMSGPAFILLALIFVLPSCTKDKCEVTHTYTTYDPIYKNLSEIRVPLKTLPAQIIENPGKIYMHGNYLFVNELKKGIHIINNTDPSAPVPVSFINIPGNVDIAAKGNTLYADNYMDLLAINITDPTAVQLSKRVENALPGFIPDGNKNILVGYEERQVTETFEQDCGANQNQMLFSTQGGGGGGVFTNGGVKGGGGKPSMGGSMARFTIYDQYLYVVSDNSLHLYNIAAPSAPTKGNVVQLGFGIETIFPYKKNLFIGSTTGMLIYSLDNPSQPSFLSTFTHARSCDPVVVEGDYAYVTLRSGTRCAGNSNQLDVIDIKNITSPRLVKTYSMTNPNGLGIDEGTLFICDGNDGLKVYNANDPEKITENSLGHYEGFDAYDVIPWNKLLIMTTKNGIFQYDYSNPSELKMLSKITTKQ
jgi:hypothetical protein